MIGVVIVLIVTVPFFLAAIQFPFDSAEWNDGRAYCICGIGSAAIAAAMFVMTCLYSCFTPLIIGAITTVIGYASIHVRSQIIRHQERKKHQSQPEMITIRNGQLLATSYRMPFSERPHIISDEEEEEKYESVF